MKFMVLIPVILPPTPCARCTILLDASWVQLRDSSPNLNLLYYCDSPIFGQITVFAVQYASGGKDWSCLNPIGCSVGGDVSAILTLFAEWGVIPVLHGAIFCFWCTGRSWSLRRL